MRRLVPALLLLILPLLPLRGQDYSALDAKMDTYFKSIEAAPTADKCTEASFMISAATDPAIRGHIAQYIFAHYSASPVMGDESVAVFVAKEWIMTGKATVSESELAEAQSYVRFNGRSLIGLKAPILTLRDVNQQTVSVFDQPREHYTVLLFYDTTCAPCAIETEYLKSYLPSAPIPLDVIAVYVGIREPSWARYRATGLTLEGVQHLWDPGIQSDFHEAYGVVKTPALFLIAPDCTIVGRRLDTKSLTALVEALAPRKEEEVPAYVYGSAESMAAFDAIFAGGGASADVLDTARYIEQRTLGEGNPDAYARTIGDLLYYLSFHRSESFREALPAFIGQYVEGREVWSASDSVQVLTLAGMMKGLLAKCSVGAPVPDVRVDGTLRRPHRRDKAVKGQRLRKLKGTPGVVVFAADSCASCEDAAPGIEKLLADGPRKLKVLITKADPALLDDFDLSSLPYIIYLDKKGIVTRRYVDL